jgi:3-deoxy-7-phosphoheptulonate synthase
MRSYFPLSKATTLAIDSYREQIKQCITGEDPRLAIVVGPCSLHDSSSALEYASRLEKLQKYVESTCVIVMRAHIEKPRSCLGWKGLLHDPRLSGEDDLIQGLFFCRELLLKLADSNIALACEFLDPLASCYFSDLISWGFIGARTSTSQPHRQLASFLPMPIGCKNGIDGNIESVIQGALSIRHPHSFLHIDDDGKVCAKKSLGNLATHIVLRGSELHPNYDSKSIAQAIHLSNESGLNSRILIDCSHGNSKKNLNKQVEVFSSVINQYKEGNPHILGVMLESHLEEGNQMFSSSICPSTSLTDPCLGWSKTEELLLSAHEELSSSSRIMSLVQS